MPANEIPKYSTQQEVDEAIEYFSNKLSFTFDASAREKLIKQIELLEDTIITSSFQINKKTRDEAYDEPIKPDSY